MRFFSFNLSKFILPVPNIGSLISTSPTSVAALPPPAPALSDIAPIPPIAVTGGICEVSYPIVKPAPEIRDVTPVVILEELVAHGIAIPYYPTPVVSLDELAQLGFPVPLSATDPSLINLAHVPLLAVTGEPEEAPHYIRCGPETGGPAYAQEAVQVIGCGIEYSAVAIQ